VHSRLTRVIPELLLLMQQTVLVEQGDESKDIALQPDPNSVPRPSNEITVVT